MLIFNAKNLKDNAQQQLPELVVNIVQQEKNRDLIRKDLDQTEQALIALKPDQKTTQEAVNEFLVRHDSEKAIGERQKINPHTLDTVPLNPFETTDDYLKNDFSSIQSTALNQNETIEAMEAFKNSIPARTHATEIISEIKSKTLEKYKRKILYFEQKTGLYGINYASFKAEYDGNYSRLQAYAKQAKDLSIAPKLREKFQKLEWEFLAKQIFLEFFIITAHSNRQIGVNKRTTGLLRKKYNEFSRNGFADAELSKILEDVILFYDGARSQYSFFYRIARKAMEPYRKWANEIFENLVEIKTCLENQTPLPTHSKIFSIKDRLMTSEEFLKSMQWEELTKLLDQIKKSYSSKSKNIEEVAEVSQWALQFNNILTNPEAKVFFEKEHPLYKLTAELMGGIKNVEALNHQYVVQNLLKLFNPHASRADQFEAYYILSGFHALRKNLWSLRAKLLDNESFIKRDLASSRTLTHREKDLIEHYDAYLKKMEQFIERITQLGTNFSNYLSHFDTDVFGVMEDLGDLISATDLPLLLLPELNREKTEQWSDEQIEQALEKSGINLSEHSRLLYSSLFRHTYLVQEKLDELALDPIHQSQVTEFRIMLKDYFDLLKNILSSLNSREHAALSALIQKIYKPYDSSATLEKNLIISLDPVHILNKELEEVFNYQSPLPNQNIKYLKVIFSEGQILKNIFGSGFKNGVKTMLGISDFDRKALEKLVTDKPDQIPGHFEKIFDIRNQDLLPLRGLLKTRLNGSAEKKYAKLFNAVAKMALTFADSTGHDRPQCFYILPHKKNDGTLSFRISLEETLTKQNDLSWMLFGLPTYAHQSTQGKIKVSLPMELHSYEKEFANSELAIKIFKPQISKLKLEQKEGFQKLSQQKIGETSSETFTLLSKNTEDDRALMKKAGLEAGKLKIGFVSLLALRLKKTLNYYGLNSGENELNESLKPAESKEVSVEKTAPVKSPRVQKTDPYAKILKPISVTDISADIGQIAKFNINDIFDSLKRHDDYVVLELDPRVFHSNNTLLHTITFANRHIDHPEKPEEKIDILTDVILKNPNKYKFSNKSIKKLELTLTLKDISNMPDSIKDLIAALNRNPENASVIAELENEKNNQRLYDYLSGKAIDMSIQFVKNGVPVEFHHLNTYDTLSILNLKPNTSKPMRLVIQKTRSKELTFTTLSENYAVKLENSKVKMGYAGQENLSRSKPLSIYIPENPNSGK